MVQLCLLQDLLCSAQEGEPKAPAWLPRAISSWEAFAAALGPCWLGSPARAHQQCCEIAAAACGPWEELALVSRAKSAKHGHLQAQGLLPTLLTARIAAPGLAHAPPSSAQPLPQFAGQHSFTPARGQGQCLALWCPWSLAGEIWRHRPCTQLSSGSWWGTGWP